MKVPGSQAIGIACYLPDLCIGVFPIDLSLTLQPNSASLIKSFTAYVSSSQSYRPIQSLLFVPLTVYTQLLPLKTITNHIESMFTGHDMKSIHSPLRVILHHVSNLFNLIVTSTTYNITT